MDTNSRLYSALLLASVNLPGGELRRKSIEDELAMREYLKEGDLVNKLLLKKNKTSNQKKTNLLFYL